MLDALLWRGSRHEHALGFPRGADQGGRTQRSIPEIEPDHHRSRHHFPSGLDCSFLCGRRASAPPRKRRWRPRRDGRRAISGRPRRSIARGRLNEILDLNALPKSDNGEYMIRLGWNVTSHEFPCGNMAEDDRVNTCTSVASGCGEQRSTVQN